MTESIKAALGERKAHEESLASGVAPVVDPFPHWKYNVFDPSNTTHPHHRSACLHCAALTPCGIFLQAVVVAFNSIV